MSHPYYPKILVLPHYVAPTLTTVPLLGIFFSVVGAILLASWAISKRYNSSLSIQHRLIYLWFVLCGFIHFFFEGYFAVTHATIASRTDLFGQLWKEYSKADSRYMTSDSFVVIMESITALLWGVGSFVMAYAIVWDTPYRYILQFLVSTGQLYGDVLYYLTTLFEGAPHARPEGIYFWFYFVFLNAFWIVIPIALMWQSWDVIVERMSSSSGKTTRSSLKRKTK